MEIGDILTTLVIIVGRLRRWIGSFIYENIRNLLITGFPTIFVIVDVLVAVLGSGTYLKSFPDVFRLILTRYGDPIRVHF